MFDVFSGSKMDDFVFPPGQVLHLQFYINEFDLCNPIGAKRGKYKLTAVYFVLGNCPQRIRFREDFIFLGLLACHRHVKKHDPQYERLFSPLVSDMEKLKDSIQITIDGVSQTFHACLDFVSADNLSAHELGGFQCHFNPGRICRSCTIDYSLFRENLSEASLVKRSEEIDQYQLQAVLEDERDSAIYGIKHDCVLSQLDYFKVSRSFPHIMHDFLEGINYYMENF